MKKLLVLLTVTAICTGAGLLLAEDPAPEKDAPKADAPKAGAPKADEPALPKIDMEKVSYAIGINIGRSMRTQGVELKTDSFVDGLKTALADGKVKMTDEEMGKMMQAFSMHMMQLQQQKAAEAAQTNLKEGATFMENHRKDKAVKVTKSGLQYKVVKAGTGKNPVDTDTVTVHYVGKLLDGKEFDSSRARGEPVTFQLQRVIPGWSEGVKLMNEGAIYELVIPSDLAYGPQGVPQAGIGPNATLVFEVELIKIGVPAAEKKTP